jgi:Skp family chaperone for outer membrane proteins
MEKFSVKKTILALGLAAVMLGGLTGQLQAQPTAAGTRVAVVNVGLVFSKYEKAKFYKTELETTLKPYKEKGEKIAGEMKKYGDPLKNGLITDPKMKDQYTQYLLKLKRDMEDLDAEARKLIGKKQEDQIVTLFKEVTGAIQAFAQSNGYHLILGYGQQIEGDMYSFANINRMMQGMDLGGTTPLFLVGGMDISQPVVDMLNAHYRGAGSTVPTTVPAVPTSSQK